MYRSIDLSRYVCMYVCMCMCVCVAGCVGITYTESFIWSDLVCCCQWFCIVSPFVVMSCEVMCCVSLYCLAMPSCSLVLSGSIQSGSVWSGLLWFWIACSVMVCLVLLCLIQYCFVSFDIVLPCQLWSPLACTCLVSSVAMYCVVLDCIDSLCSFVLPGMVHSGSIRLLVPRRVLCCIVSTGLVSSVQVRSGLVWSGLTWPGLVWSVLSRVFLVCCFCAIQACCVLLEYFASWSPAPLSFPRSLYLSLSIIYFVCLHRSLSLSLL